MRVQCSIQVVAFGLLAMLPTISAQCLLGRPKRPAGHGHFHYPRRRGGVGADTDTTPPPWIEEMLMSGRPLGPSQKAFDESACPSVLVPHAASTVLPTTVSRSCAATSECRPGNCCREINFCSSTDEGSLAVGETATDACECVNTLLAEATLLCACIDDAECAGNTCCREDGQCSTEDAGSVRGGRPADDSCECVVPRYDDTTGICGCNTDNHCRGDKCCMDDNVCSDEDELTVGAGDAAEDICECSSGEFDSDLGLCGCALDSECDTTNGEICCPDKKQCELPLAGDPAACGDPHMTGFHGQKFDFTGEDGAWYALISDLPSVHINMRVTAPVPSLPEITYITGLSVLTTDADGFEHSMVITVKDPHSLDSACPTDGSVCLADGALNVVFDGEEELVAPGTTVLAPGVEVTAANIPGECRSFGFEQYWERKKLEYAQADRRLRETENMGDWILGDPTVTNMAECVEYVAEALMNGNELFNHQSEHVSFRIITPTATIRLSHGRLHQLAMRDPTDQYDLPDHLTWQMNMAIDHSNISHDAQGVIGETFVPRRDANGDIIMHGMECIRGEQEDYYVEGPLGVSFTQATLDH